MNANSKEMPVAQNDSNWRAACSVANRLSVQK